MDQKLKKINQCTFIFYCLVILFILATRGYFLKYLFPSLDVDQILPRRMNLIPFADFRGNTGKPFSYVFGAEIFLNILIYIPFGGLLASSFDNKFVSFGFIFGFPLMIESLQYILATGVLDIDDYINNVCGILLGLLLYKILLKICKNNKDYTRTIIAMFSSLILIGSIHIVLNRVLGRLITTPIIFTLFLLYFIVLWKYINSKNQIFMSKYLYVFISCVILFLDTIAITSDYITI